MDLKYWMEPEESFFPQHRNWTNPLAEPAVVRPALEQKSDLAMPYLWIERCLSLEDARTQREKTSVVGVYCLTLGEGQSLLGMEMYDPEVEPPDLERDMLVSLRVRKTDGRYPELADAAPLLDPLRAETAPLIAPRLLDCASEAALCLCLERRPFPIGAAPWSDVLLERHEADHGEDARSLLPLLWFDGPGAFAFRKQFRATVVALMREAFLAPMKAACDQAGKKLFLRFAPDTSLLGEWMEGWGPASAFADFSSRPAVAMKNPQLPEKGAFSDAWPLRRAASWIEQFCREEETALRRPEQPAGPVVPLAPVPDLAGMARVTESALVTGGALFDRPKADFSLAGPAKRSQGARLFHVCQPWFSAWQDYQPGLARLNDLLSQGEKNTSILLLAPSLESVARVPLPPSHFGISQGQTEEAIALEAALHGIMQALDIFQIDYEVTDETTFCREAKARANMLRLGRRVYTSVIVPPAFSWCCETFKYLRKFARRGGTLILARPICEKIGAQTAQDLEALEEEYANVHIVERAGREVCYQLNRLDPRPFLLKSKGQGNTDALRVLHRHVENRELFYVCNTSADTPVEAQVSLYADGVVRVLDPWQPRIFVRESEEEKNAQVFDFAFPPASGTLFAVGGGTDLTEPFYQRMPHATGSAEAADVWEFERHDPNTLPLENCRWTLEGQGRSRQMPVPFARRELQQEKVDAGWTTTLTYAFESHLPEEHATLRLLLENNPETEVHLNGQALPPLEEVSRFGPDFLVYDIEEAVRPGENTLEVQFPWREDAKVESALIEGDFAVFFEKNGSPVLEREPDLLDRRSLREQGYPWYAGVMTYAWDWRHEPEDRKRYFLALDKPAAAALFVSIGKHDPVPLHKPPHRLEITRMLIEGENRLQIALHTDLFNLFGPTHLAPKMIEPDMPLENWDARPYAERRYWNTQPALADFGLTGRVRFETFDPDAPPPAPETTDAIKDADGEKEESDENSGG